MREHYLEYYEYCVYLKGFTLQPNMLHLQKSYLQKIAVVAESTCKLIKTPHQQKAQQ